MKQDIVDIMLLSVSNLERLHEKARLRRLQGETGDPRQSDDRLLGRHSAWQLRKVPSRPFRSVTISRAMTGTPQPAPGTPITGTDLGLYSITFVNDPELDANALEEFKLFRDEAAANNFKYFYEVFNPNIDIGLDAIAEIGEFLNDIILQSLAGLTKAERPEFLKIPFNGPKASRSLSGFDSELIVGVLGGGAGTTRDTFELVSRRNATGRAGTVRPQDQPCGGTAPPGRSDAQVATASRPRGGCARLSWRSAEARNRPVRPLGDDRVVTRKRCRWPPQGGLATGGDRRRHRSAAEEGYLIRRGQKHCNGRSFMRKSLGAASLLVATTSPWRAHAQDKQEVTVWSWFIQSTMEKSIDAFKKAHPDITVNYTYYNYSPEYITALKAAAASGSLPDVIGLQPGSLTQQYRDQLEPVNELAAKDGAPIGSTRCSRSTASRC